jgi:transcriptional regulator with XRE-family HTH domain
MQVDDSSSLVAAGKRLAEARERSGLSQADMAARLQVSPRSLQKYEAGEREIPFLLMLRLFHLAGTNPAWIVLGPEHASPDGETYGRAVAVGRELYLLWERLLWDAVPPVPPAAKAPLWNVLLEIATKRGSVPESMVKDAAADLLNPRT